MLHTVLARGPGGWIAQVTALAGRSWRHGGGNSVEYGLWRAPSSEVHGFATPHDTTEIHGFITPYVDVKSMDLHPP